MRIKVFFLSMIAVIGLEQMNAFAENVKVESSVLTQPDGPNPIRNGHPYYSDGEFGPGGEWSTDDNHAFLEWYSKYAFEKDTTPTATGHWEMISWCDQYGVWHVQWVWIPGA